MEKVFKKSTTNTNTNKYNTTPPHTQKGRKAIYGQPLHARVTMSALKLSILVATIPSRRNGPYLKLMDTLITQTVLRHDVEVLALFDNKHRTIGEKRQNLLHLAQGEYVVFIDDDDMVADVFVRIILGRLYAHPNLDCLVYDMLCSLEGGPTITCRYGIDVMGRPADFDTHFYAPCHTMVYKRTIAIRHPFEHMNANEDVDWGARACQDVVTQDRIEQVLYWYQAGYSESGIRAETRH